MTDKADRFTAAAAGGGLHYLAGDNLIDDEDDFDALLAASSFGSAQARAIREQTPAAAREHAQRVVDGEELCAPPEGDVDDAVSNLVYGMAHNIVPGASAVALDSGEPPTQLEGWHVERFERRLDLRREPSRQEYRFWVFAVCSTDMLWPDHRASLLQALVDHDAFDELRPDVAWRIVDCVFDVPRPPRVLSQCFDLVVDQLDVGALAVTWLPSFGERLTHRSLERRQPFSDRLGKRALMGAWVANAGLSGAPVFARHPPPPCPGLTATRPRRRPGPPPPPPGGGGGGGSANKKRRAWAAVVVLAQLAVLVAVNAAARGTGIRTVLNVSLGALSVGTVLFERVCALRRRE